MPHCLSRPAMASALAGAAALALLAAPGAGAAPAPSAVATGDCTTATATWHDAPGTKFVTFVYSDASASHVFALASAERDGTLSDPDSGGNDVVQVVLANGGGHQIAQSPPTQICGFG